MYVIDEETEIRINNLRNDVDLAENELQSTYDYWKGEINSIFLIFFFSNKQSFIQISYHIRNIY